MLSQWQKKLTEEEKFSSAFHEELHNTFREDKSDDLHDSQWSDTNQKY